MLFVAYLAIARLDQGRSAKLRPPRARRKREGCLPQWISLPVPPRRLHRLKTPPGPATTYSVVVSVLRQDSDQRFVVIPAP